MTENKYDINIFLSNMITVIGDDFELHEIDKYIHKTDNKDIGFVSEYMIGFFNKQNKWIEKIHVDLERLENEVREYIKQAKEG